MIAMEYDGLQDNYPLHYACWFNRPREVARLLLLGFDPDEFDRNMKVGVHWTAWDYAFDKRHENVLRVLLAFKRPPFHILIHQRHPVLTLNGYHCGIWSREWPYYRACRKACVAIMQLFKRRDNLVARAGCKYMARELALAVYATRATFLDAQYKSQ